ncbi:hypothetical protein [Oceanicaulis sp.]|uniref:hypothetical protein n=1 Tax=Oceanicaulis sp. TaxID=1924941 RepID=UPI003BA8FD20
MSRRTRRFISAKSREPRSGGVDPGGLMRVSGFGAALLVFVAVGAGFHGERITATVARALSGLAPLVEPLIWGVSLLELGAGILVLGVFGVTVWRGFRR